MSRAHRADTGNELDGFLASVEHRAFRIARQAIWDDDAALDVVQDAMLRLVQKYRERPPEEWPALFFTILANRIKDVRRWRMLRARVELMFHGTNAQGEPAPLDPPGIMPGVHGDPERLADSRQIGLAIEAALGKLSRRQQQVFLLREKRGLDVRTTAQVLGCSEGSVKQHHFRAMQALRKLLGEVWDE
ncbi:MAG: RNA polymerase sigma factor [Gammaproteobacteria bacterium]|nr:RNA polymerase sigma factor [Gammaproteobacteria bacterium]